MAIYRTTFRIPMAQGPLFTYMAKFSNVATWDPIVVNAYEETPGLIGLGSTFHLDIKTPRGTLPFTFKVIEFDEPNRVTLEAITKTFYSRDSISIRRITETESELTYSATLRLRGFAAILNGLLPIVVYRMGKQARQGLETTIAAQ